VNILFLTHRLPYAPNRGDRIRSHHILRVLAPVHDVHLVSLVHDDEEAAEAQGMRDLAASVQVARVSKARNLSRVPLRLPGSMPLTHVLLDAKDINRILHEHVAAGRVDAVLAYCSGMARYALASPLDRFPFVLDMVDVDSQKWASLAKTASAPRSWIYRREARLLARFEARATEAAAVTTVVNEREKESLVALAPSARIQVVPNGIDLTSFRPTGPPSVEPRVVFSGVLNYAPNEEGALWLAERVWPLVRAARPDARLVLVGAYPTTAIRRLASADASIEVTGTVPAVQPYLWSASVAAVPLKTARGLQNKVLEAIAAGLPVVTTPIVRAGLPAAVEPSCLVAESAEDFAAALLSLLARAPAERRATANRAQLSNMDWPTQLRPLVDILSTLDARRADRATARPALVR
jgi:sugar transferase (PEP-CTERM/EpsH1 system associated)